MPRVHVPSVPAARVLMRMLPRPLGCCENAAGARAQRALCSRVDVHASTPAGMLRECRGCTCPACPLLACRCGCFHARLDAARMPRVHVPSVPIARVSMWMLPRPLACCENAAGARAQRARCSRVDVDASTPAGMLRECRECTCPACPLLACRCECFHGRWRVAGDGIKLVAFMLFAQAVFFV
jgi:hypothetical protein